eukprot:4993018-Amphidinium_carterae.1
MTLVHGLLCLGHSPGSYFAVKVDEDKVPCFCLYAMRAEWTWKSYFGWVKHPSVLKGVFFVSEVAPLTADLGTCFCACYWLLLLLVQLLPLGCLVPCKGCSLVTELKAVQVEALPKQAW